ncbi:MAG: bifunctional riboflavin kinase/FAD synthetase, partial [Polyangia bacterium]
MDTFRGHTSLTRRLRNPVVAIGNFDGVHRGHAHIFQEARRLA